MLAATHAARNRSCATRDRSPEELREKERARRSLRMRETAEDFRALHAERQDVVRQWEDVIESMKRRDAAILDASRDFAKRRKEIRARRAALAERARFLEQELQNNKETDVAIGEADRGMARIRERLHMHHSDASKSAHTTSLRTAFQTYDEDRNGRLSFDEIKTLITDYVHLTLSEENIRDILETASTTVNGEMTMDEFIALFGEVSAVLAADTACTGWKD